MRRLRAKPARAALARAERAARDAGIAALVAEVEAAAGAMDATAATLVTADGPRPLRLDDVEAVFASGALVVDACRHTVRRAGAVAPLATRPVLFALARALAEAWPGDVARETLVARAFRGKEADESHRARLRVEIGRLRVALRPLADVTATRRGFALAPSGGGRRRGARAAGRRAACRRARAPRRRRIVVELGAGASRSAVSPRTVQRALEALAAAGKVQSFGRGRARRWVTPPVPGFPTALLLPGPAAGRLGSRA